MLPGDRPKKELMYKVVGNLLGEDPVVVYPILAYGRAVYDEAMGLYNFSNTYIK